MTVKLKDRIFLIDLKPRQSKFLSMLDEYRDCEFSVKISEIKIELVWGGEIIIIHSKIRSFYACTKVAKSSLCCLFFESGTYSG